MNIRKKLSCILTKIYGDSRIMILVQRSEPNDIYSMCLMNGDGKKSLLSLVQGIG